MLRNVQTHSKDSVSTGMLGKHNNKILKIDEYSSEMNLEFKCQPVKIALINIKDTALKILSKISHYSTGKET